jgi:hypothetical protein
VRPKRDGFGKQVVNRTPAQIFTWFVWTRRVFYPQGLDNHFYHQKSLFLYCFYIGRVKYTKTVWERDRVRAHGVGIAVGFGTDGRRSKKKAALGWEEL